MAEKAKKLFEVDAFGTVCVVAATSAAKARKWCNSQTTIREIGAVEAVGIDKKDVQEAE